MKLQSRFLFLSAALCIFLFSCQKEVDDNSIPVPAVTIDSSYLSKMLIIDNDGAGVIDTFETFTYVYDNLKRVSQLLDSSEDNSSNTLLPSQATQYYYNGNDTIPFKAVTYRYNAGSIDTTTHFYTYNPSGKVVADSGITHYFSTTDFQKDIRNYEYNGSTIYGMRTITSVSPGGTSVSVEKDTAQVDANGNITQNVKNRDFETVHSTFTWDNHPSPFARLSNFQTFFILPIGETFFYEMPKKNNRLHANEVATDNSGTVVHTYDDDLGGTYTYNTAGYPTQILIPDPSMPGTNEKTVFIYKAF